jgi:glycosyltransferase involved in cell wall biosynthesis
MKGMKLFGRLKRLVPFGLRRRLSWLKQLRGAGRWLPILWAGPTLGGTPQVFYGLEQIPRPGDPTYGGIVKFQGMQSLYPNSPRRFNILYMVSSRTPPDALLLLWLAHRKGARLVWNQNGVAYPGWHGPGWEWVNRPMAKLLHAADHVFYQSEFCKLSADRYLGVRQGTSEILYNPVDTTVFTPAEPPLPQSSDLVLLLAGTQYQYYRLEVALQTLAQLTRLGIKARLLITGKLSWKPDAAEASRQAQHLVAGLGLTGRVEFLGPYSQADAPAVFRQAHLLLHTKYNDPCPTVVLEAMACGLPVVYARSGGVPELVGDEAGVGLQVPLSWERDYPAAPEALAEAVLRVADACSEFSAAARRRAVEKFDLQLWLRRHREVFEALLSEVR